MPHGEVCHALSCHTVYIYSGIQVLAGSFLHFPHHPCGLDFVFLYTYPVSLPWLQYSSILYFLGILQPVDFLGTHLGLRTCFEQGPDGVPARGEGIRGTYSRIVVRTFTSVFPSRRPPIVNHRCPAAVIYIVFSTTSIFFPFLCPVMFFITSPGTGAKPIPGVMSWHQIVVD